MSTSPLPCNIRAEESLVGAMLLSVEAIEDAIGVVDVSHFYHPSTRDVFDSILAVYESGSSVDAVTVAEELNRAGRLEAIGGPAVLMDWQATTPAISNAQHYAGIIESHARLRRMVSVGQQISSLGMSSPDDVDGAVTNAERLVDDLAASASRATVRPVAMALSEYRANMDTPLPTVPTGYAGLDDVIGGWLKSHLNLVGAPSGVGKSIVLNGTTIASCEAGRPTRVNNLELSFEEVINRLVAVKGNIDLARLTRRTLTRSERERRDAALAVVESWPLYIDDDPAPTLASMRSAAREIKREHGEVGLWVFENLQLWKPTPGTSRQAEVAEASRTLKVFAKTVDVPVVVAVQLNNMATGRSDKRPKMQDIRESSAPYHDASVVVFLYREGFYDTCDNPYHTEMIVEKQRNGPRDSVTVFWNPPIGAFESPYSPTRAAIAASAADGWSGDGHGFYDRENEYVEEF